MFDSDNMSAHIDLLEAIVSDGEWNEYHGCFTGDCPHDNANDCILEIRKMLQERKAEVAKMLSPNENPEGEK